MSVISFPRRPDVVRPRPTTTPRSKPARGRSRRPSHAATTPRRAAAVASIRRTSPLRRSAIVIVVALAISLVGSMVVANRQIQLHTLQSQLLQDQSTFAEHVGTSTLMAAPSKVATQAGTLHLVAPVSVTQVPSTSLDAPLSLPKFIGYAPVTSRTIR